jgi:hypothetical protein
MISQSFRFFAKWARASSFVMAGVALLLSAAVPALSMNSALNGSLPQPLPLFPRNNWWNRDISNWPVDPNSANYIAFINNNGTRRLHPGFGGNAGTTHMGKTPLSDRKLPAIPWPMRAPPVMIENRPYFRARPPVANAITWISQETHSLV